MFGAQVNVDDALAFVRRAHGQVFVAILIDVSEIGQRESKSEQIKSHKKTNKQTVETWSRDTEKQSKMMLECRPFVIPGERKKKER